VPLRQRHGVVGSFLGADAWLDKAPAVLAARTGAPLVVAAAARGPAGVHVLSTLLVLDPPAGAGLAWAERATRQAAAALEAFVRERPESWLWLHRRWKTPPP
jgi:KDO2-lipid IV(A) lauroyltransferase